MGEVSGRLRAPKGTHDLLPPESESSPRPKPWPAASSAPTATPRSARRCSSRHGALRTLGRRDDRHRPQGDVHVRRSEGPLADAAPREHGRGRPRARREGHPGDAAADPSLVRRSPVSLRAAAGRAVPRVPADRRRAVRGRVGGRRRRGPEMLFAFLGALGFTRADRRLSTAFRTARGARPSPGRSRRTCGRGAGKLGPEDRKLAENPLRLFDSKDPEAGGGLEGAPATLDFLDEPSPPAPRGAPRRSCAGRRAVRRERRDRPRPRLLHADGLRGRLGGLGAQNAILGGGRYDGLVGRPGRPADPRRGFRDRRRPAARGRCRPTSERARPSSGRPSAEPRSLPTRSRVAARSGPRFPSGASRATSRRARAREGTRPSRACSRSPARVFDREAACSPCSLGTREREEEAVTLKDLATGEQETFPRAELAERLGAARER